METPVIKNWWILSLFLAAKRGATESFISLISLTLLFLLVWLATALLYWSSPGGPAWGKYWWSNGGRAGAAEACRRRDINKLVIPGPRGLPFLGSMGLMFSLAHRQLAAAAEHFDAKRLIAISLGDTRVIITGDPDVAKEILNSSVFADRPVKESAYGLMFHRAIGFAPYGVYWRTLRRIAATHLFCPKQISSAELQRFHIAGQMIAALGSKREGGTIRVRDVLKQGSLNSIMWSVFGRRYEIATCGGGSVYDREMSELRHLVKEGYDLLGMLNYSDHLPLLAALDLQKIRSRCSKLVPRVNHFVNRVIEEHRRTNHYNRNRATTAAAAAAAAMSGIAPDFVDVLLSLQGGSDSLSDSDMVAVLWEMIFRGTDTVAVLIEWVLARLALHRDVQEKVHRELDRVVGRSRPVVESDTPSLVYLRAVVKEVLRIHPPGPLLSWARLATSDTVVDGRHVPSGTTAMVNMWAITHDSRVWPEPTEFRPERFLGKEEGGCDGAGVELGSVFGSDLRLAPFGAGRRSCPGKALAMTTVNFWVASLLHEFDWLPPSDGTRVDLSEVLRLSCEMAVPLAVRLRPRRS